MTYQQAKLIVEGAEGASTDPLQQALAAHVINAAETRNAVLQAAARPPSLCPWAPPVPYTPPPMPDVLDPGQRSITAILTLDYRGELTRINQDNVNAYKQKQGDYSHWLANFQNGKNVTPMNLTPPIYEIAPSYDDYAAFRATTMPTNTQVSNGLDLDPPLEMEYAAVNNTYDYQAAVDGKVSALAASDSSKARFSAFNPVTKQPD